MNKTQIDFDIETLKFEFAKMSGVWEYHDGDACGCVDIAERELILVKNVAKRYPDFSYEYNPENFDYETENEFVSVNDFKNNRVDSWNYCIIDAIAFDMQQELISYLKSLL